MIGLSMFATDWKVNPSQKIRTAIGNWSSISVHGRVAQRNLPAGLTQIRTWTSRFIRLLLTSHSQIHHKWHCINHQVIPFPVVQQSSPVNVAPSLQRHYSTFITTTNNSAPVLHIGTLPITVLTAFSSPLTLQRQVPTFRTIAQIRITLPPYRMPCGPSTGAVHTYLGDKRNPQFWHHLAFSIRHQ